MKKIVLFGLLLLSFAFVKAQNFNSSIAPTTIMETTYRNDACRLAINRMYQIDSLLADSITIPNTIIDTMLKGLYAIANMQNAIVRDTIIDKFGFTNFEPQSDSTHFSYTSQYGYVYGLKKIRLVVDNTYSWGAQWQIGNYATTNNDTVNYLIDKYQLVVEKDSFQFYPTRTRYIITSPVAINAKALAKKFGQFTEVGNEYAYDMGGIGNYYFTNKNTIQCTIAGDTLKMMHNYGCGDCPSGCTLGRIWKFNVLNTNTCTVNYLSVENWGGPVAWLTNACFDYTTYNTVCSKDSTAFYSYSPVGGNSTYQWQVSSNGAAYTNIYNDSNYSGTNTSTLKLYNIPSAWYGNTYSIIFNGERRKLFFKLKIENTWTNTTSGAWENAANWSCGTLPDSNTDVVIKGGIVHLNTNVSIRSLTLLPGATLNIANGVQLTILH